jgi:hypothetical protein
MGTGSSHIPKEITTKQVATSCQDADGTPGVPWNMQDLSVEPIFREIVSVIDGEVGNTNEVSLVKWFHDGMHQ